LEAAMNQSVWEGASMRKQNHSMPSVSKHNSGLNNSVVLHRNHKRPNAQKHGVYTTAPIIPGEDLQEFEQH
jgi:hypothetical protein